METKPKASATEIKMQIRDYCNRPQSDVTLPDYTAICKIIDSFDFSEVSEHNLPSGFKMDLMKNEALQDGKTILLCSKNDYENLVKYYKLFAYKV